MPSSRHPFAPQRVGRSASGNPKLGRCSPHVSHIVCLRSTMPSSRHPSAPQRVGPSAPWEPKAGFGACSCPSSTPLGRVAVPVDNPRRVAVALRWPWSGTCRRRGPLYPWAAAAGASGRAARSARTPEPFPLRPHHRHPEHVDAHPPSPCAHALRPTVPRVIAAGTAGTGRSRAAAFAARMAASSSARLSGSYPSVACATSTGTVSSLDASLDVGEASRGRLDSGLGHSLVDCSSSESESSRDGILTLAHIHVRARYGNVRRHRNGCPIVAMGGQGSRTSYKICQNSHTHTTRLLATTATRVPWHGPCRRGFGELLLGLEGP